METLVSILFPICMLFFLFNLIGSLEGVIRGKFVLLNKLTKKSKVRTGSLIVLVIAIIVFVILYFLLISKINTVPTVFATVVLSVAILIFVASIILATHIEKKREHRFGRYGVATTYGEGGPLGCSQCGRFFNHSLRLVASENVRIAHCRACPVDSVYAVCERCANLEKVQRSVCPSCGASHLWEITTMVTS